MTESDKKIAEILGKFGEPMAGSVWRVQGTAVIYHKTLERIAAQAKITWDEPKVIRAERDEAVIQVTGRLPDGRMEWSIGEAVIGVNYRVSGKQAAYVWAMAEKRAKDRVILKLIELHGLVYSEDESDEFRESAPNRAEAEMVRQSVESGGGQGAREYTEDDRKDERTADDLLEPEEVTELKKKIRAFKTINAVTDFMLKAETQQQLAEMHEPFRESIRDTAKARLVELGWPTKKAG